MGVITRVGGGKLDSATGELDVLLGWGHAGQGGVTMPGKGRAVERDYTAAELHSFAEGAPAIGLTTDIIRHHLGSTTFDIYLNDVAFWSNVPAHVWEYTIGGYQLVKKWLSYREHRLLGRALKPDEVRHVTSVVHRIGAILLMAPQLDESYSQCCGECYTWPELDAQPTLLMVGDGGVSHTR
jgi:hypothetical protein